jgi:hypothetical protein
VIDNASRTIGFPDVELRVGQFYEQGIPLHLRGVVWHEESYAGGATLPREQMERDMAMIKSLGANAVRFAFHPPHPYLLDLCSRYGLYALVEIPVWTVPAAVLDQDAMRSLAQQAARETVEQLRHHPSVFAWGVAGNVDAEDDRTATFVAAVVSVVRSMDKRPVYAGLGPGQSDKTAPFLDLAGILLRSSDLKEFRSTLASVRAMYKDRPALVLSYGPQVEHENRNGYRDPWSQEAQARFYLQHIAALMESGFSGGFVDAFSDWRGDRPVLTGHSIRSGS